MGYYTDYELSIYDGPVDRPDVDVINKWIENSDLGMTVYGIYLDKLVGGIKWYDNEYDVKELSKAFPDIVFLLEGWGEETGDAWRKYFKNGKVQRANAKITFDDYDESKLEE